MGAADAPNQPGAYAFRMYLNYDGAGGPFGDTGVTAASADQDKLSVYAPTARRDGTHHHHGDQQDRAGAE